MSREQAMSAFRLWRYSIIALACLALLSLVVCLWLLFDFSHEQRIVEKITEHLPASDLPQARELARELRLQSRLSVLLIFNLVGTVVALRLVGKAFRAGEQSIQRMHVQAEDTLASLDHGVLTADKDGLCLSVNPKGIELLSLEGNGTGIALAELPPPHQMIDDVRIALLHGTTHTECEYDVHREDRTEHFRVGGSVLHDHDHREVGVVIHVQDETEKILLQQRMLKMERYMGLGSLAAGLQHEIKNPLSALSLHIQLVKEGIAEGKDLRSVDESLGVLRDEVRRISSVLERFRDFASLKELEISPVDIRQVIRRTIRLTRVQAEQRGVELCVEMPPGEETVAEVDAVRLEQVLLNLLLNAFDALPGGGKVNLRLSSSVDTFQISVQDNGPGIPEELREEVFNAYFTTKSNGTGMGLPLCEKVVRQHSGALHLKSDNEGTTFVIQIPIRQSVGREEESLHSS